MKRPSMRIRMFFVIGCSIVPLAAAQVARDSARIRIVENSRPLLAPGRMWRVQPEPFLQIGRADGDSLYQFLRVMGVARLSDGRIAVANQGTSTVRFFDQRGNWQCPTLTCYNGGLGLDPDKQEGDRRNAPALPCNVVKCPFVVARTGGHFFLHGLHGQHLNPYVYCVSDVEG